MSPAHEDHPRYDGREDVLARPGESYSEHVEETCERMRALVSDDQLVGPDNDDRLWPVARTIALLHDIGKLTSFFQGRVRDDVHVPQEDSRMGNHALTGAFISLVALRKQGVSEPVGTAAFYAVRKHHTGLPDIPDNHNRYLSPHKQEGAAQLYDRVETQIDSIDADPTTRQLAADWITEATDCALLFDQVVAQDPANYRHLLADDPESVEGFYPLMQRLWSLLTAADKLAASNAPVPERDSRNIDPGDIQERIASFGEPDSETEQALNSRRTMAREQAWTRLRNHGDSEQLFRLTLPTGFGKTFAGLEAGLRLSHQQGSRVVYALPFTSVIDQVNEVCQRTFGVDAGSEAYTVHHHLTDTYTTIEAEEVETPNTGAEAIYGESWQAELVLTTFVQLFESLAGPENTQSIKLPALQDSVVIVDEPQALPPHWWPLVARLTTVLMRHYDATVILMTATQPRFIEGLTDLSPTPLVTDYNDHVSFIGDHPRVRFVIDDSVREYIERPDEASPLSISRAASRILSAADGDGLANVLAVGNTIDSAVSLGDAVIEQAREADRTVVGLGSRLREFLSEGDRSATLLEAVRGGESTSPSPVTSPEDGGDDRPNLAALAKSYLTYLSETVRGEATSPILKATLTTRLRPMDRSLLIDAMKQVLADEPSTPFDEIPFIVTSTQLVEAGVDVSFDRLYRDIAPVPSIVQAAGRCNRSMNDQTRTVTVWRLAAPDDAMLPSELYMRGRDRLRPTRAAIRAALSGSSEDGVIEEPTMLTDAVETYYEQFLIEQEGVDPAAFCGDQAGADPNPSIDDDPLVNQFEQARGEQLREQSLIDDTTEDVLVVLTDSDERLVQRYDDHLARGEHRKAQEVYDDLKLALTSVRDLPSESNEQTCLRRIGDRYSSVDAFEIVDARSRGYAADQGGLEF